MNPFLDSTCWIFLELKHLKKASSTQRCFFFSRRLQGLENSIPSICSYSDWKSKIFLWLCYHASINMHRILGPNHKSMQLKKVKEKVSWIESFNCNFHLILTDLCESLKRFKTPTGPCGYMILYTRLFRVCWLLLMWTPTRICANFISVTWHIAIIDWGYMRATSHMSQEAWPCNGEDPWLSFKGRTMGVGKATVFCSHGSSSIVWSENGPCCRTIAYFVGGKRGENLVNIICLKLYPFKKIIWWVFICFGIYLGTYPWNMF